jgi:2-dehydro-3-deoxyphosphogluconate aldolase / (4S)-4-hydroxy-2-oxoglutarate aldolase
VSVREHLRSGRVLAVLRLGPDSPDPIELADRLAAAGVLAVECTMDSPDALGTVARLREALDSSVIVGAGTVTDVAQLGPLASVGATFVVSPHTDETLIERALSLSIEPIPGVLTPTEVQRAKCAGASIIKLFPAGPMGVGYLRAISAPFRDVDWVPTGGIELTDAAKWLDAGALCVGIGSALWTTPQPEAIIRRLQAQKTRR